MFMASHMVSGGLMYDTLRNEPRWLKWTLFGIGILVLHWLLDSTPVWHDMDWSWDAWQWFVALWNGVFIIIWLWQFDRPNTWWRWLSKVFAKRLLIGLSAWLILDIWWVVYRPFGQWLHDIFPNIGRWESPQSFALEALFIALLALLGFRQILGRKRRTSGPHRDTF
ncbi:hypothetical protein ACFLX5_05755 [Chloroflexota bacterium]